MRNLSDTIARLAALGAKHGSETSDHRSSDRLSLLTDFGSDPGALKAKFYLPKNLPKDAPLVVVLHGCTQNAAGYDHCSGWSQLADQAGFALLFPEQQRVNNPNLCFNWFLPADSKRASGEALSIRQMIEAMVTTHRLDRTRIFVTGLSAGGAMAAVMLATYPEAFAGGAIIAGLPYGSAATVPQAFDRMRGHGLLSERDLQQLLRDASTHEGQWPRISIWHGAADQTVAPSNAQSIAAQWRGVHQLERAPTHSETTGLRARQVWTNAAGEVVVEINMIAGMGHGTPLGNDGLGTPGPYMLAVGISSTREIAKFWGIAETTQSAFASSRQVVSTDTLQPPSFPTKPASNLSSVTKIIEDALCAAGLMR